MKKRKIAVVAFMLIAVLTLSVGYAALTDILAITGNLEVTAAGAQVGFDEKIYFTDAVVTKGASTGSYIDSAAIDTSNADKASFTVNSLNSSDDEVIFTFTVTNFSDHIADLTVEATKAGNTSVANPSLDNDAFDISYVINNGTDLAAQGGTATIVVTVKLADGVTPPTEGSVTGLYDLEITATAAN